MTLSENFVKIVVVSSGQNFSEFLGNIIDRQKFLLKTILPKPELISEIRKIEPDIYIVDSSGSEDEVLKTCQNIRNYSGKPILVLAADHRPEFVQMVLDTGADEYLIKPVSASILVASLNNLTRRARAEMDAALAFVKGQNEKSQQSGLLTY